MSYSIDWAVYDVGSEGGPYRLPAQLANLCLCNTVLWNLLSACSMCQGSPAGSWAAWTANCLASNTNIKTYPLPIPAGIPVPHWAYYDFTNTGVFNAVIASQQSGPESTAAANAPTASPSPTQTGSVSPSPLQPTTTADSKPTNNTGAIIGGVVGGVLGLGLIALAAFVLVRKNKSKTGNSSHSPQDAQDGHNPPAGTQLGPVAPMMAQYQSQPERPGMVPVPSSGSEYVYKPYNPNDPSTFPAGFNTSSPPTSFAEALPYPNASQYRPPPGVFAGSPQV